MLWINDLPSKEIVGVARGLTTPLGEQLSDLLDPMRAVAKTHKATDSKGNPKSRPIVGAARGLTTPLGEQLSDLLDPVARTRDRIWEAQSTEEVLRKIGEANQKLEEEGAKEIMIGSLDVEALYPSIDQKIGLEIVTREVVRYDFEYENVDICLFWVCIYIYH